MSGAAEAGRSGSGSQVLSQMCAAGQDPGCRGCVGRGRGAPPSLRRKSEGEAPELIGRLDASSMPEMFCRRVSREEEGREGGRVGHMGKT